MELWNKIYDNLQIIMCMFAYMHGRECACVCVAFRTD